MTRIRAELGWAPRMSLADGLRAQCEANVAPAAGASTAAGGGAESRGSH